MAVDWMLAAFIALPVVGGALIGSTTSASVNSWYKRLRLPSWDPPDWVFPLAWTTLYAMMGVASWLVWRRGGYDAQSQALNWYAIQLALNFAWAPLFFNARQLGWSMLLNLGLLASAAWTTVLFTRVSPQAGRLLWPYLAWLAFANALNFNIWQNNQGGAAPSQSEQMGISPAQTRVPGMDPPRAALAAPRARCARPAQLAPRQVLLDLQRCRRPARSLPAMRAQGAARAQAAAMRPASVIHNAAPARLVVA